MHILISNDDGYKSKGIQVSIKELEKYAQITVVAPSRNRSGASSSLSLDRSIKVTQKDDSFYYLSGTPTDQVHIALTGLMHSLPDMVISGINHGPNLGDDTIYSEPLQQPLKAISQIFPLLQCQWEVQILKF